MLTVKLKIVVVAYLIHITGVYSQNFEWPGVLVRGITMPTLFFTHLSERY